MAWGGISAKGKTELYCSEDDDERWNSKDYVSIIKNNAENLLLDEELIL